MLERSRDTDVWSYKKVLVAFFTTNSTSKLLVTTSKALVTRSDALVPSSEHCYYLPPHPEAQSLPSSHQHLPYLSGMWI